ncbi:MAG TPA: hypothetical protein DD477_08860 [Spirochaetaceae bacterium]|nr:hypothetical protein [Spirochaetaceae bacterium]HAX38648.1 hypothetical protein [Spirochaetaceae bacterium]HBO41312.1 hypothetical protein [Spirochaetaceae bacterium]HCQ87810.1 hypothetical protein [Spirochaetaceae bacterium]
MLSLKPVPVSPPLAGYAQLPELKRPWIDGYLTRFLRRIPHLRTDLDWRDRLGALAAGFSFGRGRYRVLPGLYALGEPDATGPVLVTANYKLTVDLLRAALSGLSAWLLVLDTRGVNVWCAAGKGSFGTVELLAKLKQCAVADLVSHRQLILPQLGAPGVSAPAVAKQAGWRIVWGPVRAADLPRFLASGLNKTEAMATVNFDMADRLRVAPVEMVQSWPVLAAGLVLAAVAAIFGRLDFADRLNRFVRTFLAIGGIWASGTVLFPILLPWLPGLAFGVKAGCLGLAWGVAGSLLLGSGPWFGAALTLASGAVVSFLGMNLTGASTYTSQTGALLEVERSTIPQAVSLLLAAVLSIVGLLVRRGAQL